jgi:hypothetical protein
MLEDIQDRSTVKLLEFPFNSVSEEIIDILRNNEAFQESAVFGEQGLGEPEEYEKLIIEDENGCREFEYFNKAIWYMGRGGEKERPVFQVFAHFMISLQEE